MTTRRRGVDADLVWEGMNQLEIADVFARAKCAGNMR
jgi:hypothetical protein